MAPSSLHSPPSGFAWLSPRARPTEEEVEAYARVILSAEHEPIEKLEAHRREAELQLWIWRSEMEKRAGKRRRTARNPDAP
jgi:hypothetical protein